MYERGYFKAYLFKAILLMNTMTIFASPIEDESPMLKKVNQLWLQGFHYYEQGDYQKAYDYFIKSRDVSEGKVWSSDYPPQDAINHCLYLLGRENEIDKNSGWIRGNYYIELDTLRLDDENFKQIWRALDNNDSEQVHHCMNTILRTDTLCGLEGRYVHAKKLEYVGNQCHWQGMYEDATYYLRPALNLERKLTPPKFRHNLYEISNKLIDSYLKIGMGDSAIAIAIQHLEDYQNNPSDTLLEGYSNGEDLLIHVLMSLELYDEAWGEIEFADSVINARFPRNNHLYGTSWKIEFYKAIGRQDIALKLSKKLVEINKPLYKDINFFRIEDNKRLINTLMGINDFESAIPIQRDIIAICDTSKNMSYHNWAGEQYNLMSLLYLGNQDYENAKYWLNKADSVLSSYMFYQQWTQHMDNMNLLSILAIATKDDSLYNKSIYEMDKFIELNYKNKNTYEPIIILIKGIYEAEKKKWNKAIDYFKKHLEYPNIDQYNVIENLSKCYLHLNKPDSAYYYADVLVKNRRNYIVQNFENLSNRERELFWNRSSTPFNILCRSIVESRRDELIGQLYDDVALYSKGLLLTASTSPDYLQRLQITWHEVQHCLKKNEAAVEFIATPHENADSSLYVALVLRKNSIQPCLIRIGKGEQLKNAFSKGNESTELSEMIWRSLSKELKGVKTIWFSVDGVMHKLPIEYLLYQEGKYINEIYKLNRLTSTRELVTHRADIKGNTAVLYGDLTYSPSTDTSSFDNDYSESLVRSAANNPLRFTKDEIAFISSIIKSKGFSCKVYDRRQGTRSSILSLSGKTINILHIATHGYYYENDSTDDFFTISPSMIGSSNPYMSKTEKAMLRSGLIMSDSLLTAYDVSHMHLNDLSLVTLSACGSGLGDIGEGEGVFGLQRAFKQAGAQSIIMTLWDVDDYMTFRFMEHFYSKLASGFDKQKALKSAQKMVRKTKINGKYEYQNPLFWAGYVLLDAFD